MKKRPLLLMVLTLMALVIFSSVMVGCGKKDTSAPVAAPTTEVAQPEKPSVPADNSTNQQTTSTVSTGTPNPAPSTNKPTPTKQPTAAAATPSSSTQPTNTTPIKPAAQIAPAALNAPASLTGTKAEAYKLLINCKNAGNASSTWNAVMFDVPILGDVDMKVTTSGSSMSGEGIPASVGGDFTNRSLSTLPFNEINSGNAAALEAFLRTSASVSVSGSVIKIDGQPPSSIVSLLNNVAPGKVTWNKKNLTMSCTIDVTGNSVTNISVDNMTGTCNAPLGQLKGKVSGTVKY